MFIAVLFLTKPIFSLEENTCQIISQGGSKQSCDEEYHIKLEYQKHLEKYHKEEYKYSHNHQNYNKTDFEKRYEIFKNNKKIIEEHNKGNHSWKMGMNKFGALYPNEVQSYSTCATTSNSPITSFSNIKLTLPAYCTHIVPNPLLLDWSSAIDNPCNINAVSPVLNQGTCGSCYAFSTIGSIESAFAIKNNIGNPESLSAQQIVDCTYNKYPGGYNKGCQTGRISNALDYTTKNNICTSTTYPYTGELNLLCNVPATCTNNKITGYQKILNNFEVIKNALQAGPLSAGFSFSKATSFYIDGIYSGACDNTLRHAVLIVGYGEDVFGTFYWILKNSWGNQWGDGGYIKIKDFKNVIPLSAYSGPCGLYDNVYQPII
jgi:C1A family cysteine protease